MKKYELKVKMTFTGTVVVEAENKEKAKWIADTCLGMSIGNIQTTTDEIVDWNFDMTPEKTVK